MLKTLMMSAALALIGTAGSAAISSKSVIESLSAQGFTRIDVKRGLTQFKVRAIRGDEKLDLVLDSASGMILQQSKAHVLFFDNTAPGFYVSDRRHDFLNPGNPTSPTTAETRGSVVASAHPAVVQGSATGAMAALATDGPAAEEDLNSDVRGGMQTATAVRIDGSMMGIVAGDYFPMAAIDADGDGIADPYVWEGDGQITIDDGWVWVDDGTGLIEPDPIDGGVSEGDGGTGDEWVDDGTGDEWVDDGTGDEWVDDGTGDGTGDGTNSTDDGSVKPDGIFYTQDGIVMYPPVLLGPPDMIDPTDPSTAGNDPVGEVTDDSLAGGGEGDQADDSSGDATGDGTGESESGAATE